MALFMNMSVLYHTTPELDKYVPSFGVAAISMTPHSEADMHQALGKQLSPSGGKNKPSMEKMVIQGRESWDKYTAPIYLFIYLFILSSIQSIKHGVLAPGI